VLKRHLDAAVAYRARPLRAPLHVLRTAESEAAIESEWAQYTPALTRHTVPGDTLSMLKPPHVDAVGRVLGRLLAGAP
jgi:thioesterase domain-containing protein